VLAVEEMRIKNQEKWKRESGYHMRSIVKSIFFVFKTHLVNIHFSKKNKRDEEKKELMLKALVYNKHIA